MKKLRGVGIVLVIALCIFGIAGCNKEKEQPNQNPNDISDKVDTISKDDEKDLQKIIGDSKIEETTSGEGNESGDSGNASSKVKLSSTEDRAVFNFGNAYYIIFDFSGDQVTNYSYCYMYDDEDSSKQAYELYMQQLKDVGNSELTGLENVKEIKRDGKYITITMNEATSQQMTKDEVMETYKYLEKIVQE